MNNLKLNKLNSHRLNKQALASIKGGATTVCGCGCHYAGSGGSSVGGNRSANNSSGKESRGGNVTYEITVTPSSSNYGYTERVPGNYLME